MLFGIGPLRKAVAALVGMFPAGPIAHYLVRRLYRKSAKGDGRTHEIPGLAYFCTPANGPIKCGRRSEIRHPEQMGHANFRSTARKTTKVASALAQEENTGSRPGIGPRNTKLFSRSFY